MTALPPDLREAVETVRAGIAIHPDEPTDVMVDLERRALDALALIEQRLMEYERVVEAARIVVADFDIVYGPIVDALADLDSPKEKP